MMKRIVLFLALGWLVLVAALAVGYSIRNVRACGVDFSMRMGEAECLRRGVDPYDVWSERVVLKPFYSNCHQGPIPDGCNRMTNAYVPWEYSLALPFSFLPLAASWWIYQLVMLAAAGAVVLLPICETGAGDRSARLLFVALATTVVSYPLWSNSVIGNNAVFCLLGAVGLAVSLNRGHEVAAGLWWALAMIKPQLGLPLAIPLLMRRKWRVGAVAVLACVVLSIPPAIMCGKSPVDLVLCAPSASAFAFEGCGTWPRFMCGALGCDDILVGTLVGAVACVAMTWMLRRERDWIVVLMPAAITSCCWTYTQAYSHAMGWFVAFVLVRELVRKPQSRFLWILFALSLVFLSRWFLAWHGLCAFAGWRFPMSEYAFRCVDSLNSTLSLAVAFAFCIWKSEHLSSPRF